MTIQINGYSSAYNSYNLKTKNVSKTDRTFETQVAKKISTTSIEETQKLTEEEEMEVFKKEIHEEISKIYGSASSAILSNSIHITEGAFKKMKSDPEFKDKMMNILREDSNASHLLPYQVNITTTIDENGYSSYGASVYPHDSAKTKSDKKDEADKKAQGAFYHKSNYAQKMSQSQLDKIWLQNKEEQEMFRQTQVTRSLLQQSQTRNTLINNRIL